MNIREDEHDKEKAISPNTLEDEQFSQLPTTPHPSLSIDKVVSYRHEVLDSRAIDEMPTLILPAIPSTTSRWWHSISIDEMATWVLPVTRPNHARDIATKSQKAFVADTESMLAPVRKLIKSSGIYGLASMIVPLISLLLAPFLTHSLTPSDYGILTILNTMIGLGAGITQLGLGSAFFRAYGYDYTSSSDRRDVLGTMVTLLCLVSSLTLVGTAIIAPFLAHLLFGQSSLWSFVLLAAGVVLLQNLTLPGFSWLRAESRALFYSLLSISNVLITLIANIALVGALHLGITGSLIATGCGYGSAMICILPLIVRHAVIRMRVDIVRNLLAFGFPLVFNFFSFWILQLSDRYLLSIFNSLAESARYAVSYTLGSAMSVVLIGPFTLAWPTAMYTIAKRKDAFQIFKLVFRWFSMLLLFAAFASSLVATILLEWLFPVTYHSGTIIIPVVAESMAFYGIYHVFMVGVAIRRKTWFAIVFTAFAALANVGLNIILIPQYGSLGAAVSTLIAYALLALMAYVVNQRLYPIPFEIGKFMIALLGGTAIYIGSNLLAQSQEKYLGWGISIAALALYGGCLTLLGIFPRSSHD